MCWKCWPVSTSLLMLCTSGTPIDEQTDQKAVAYASVTVMFAVFLVVVFYHVYTYTTVFSSLNRLKLFKKLTKVCVTSYQLRNAMHDDDIYTEFVDVLDRPNNGSGVAFSIVDLPEASGQVQPPQPLDENINVAKSDLHTRVEQDMQTKLVKQPQSDYNIGWKFHFNVKVVN